MYAVVEISLKGKTLPGNGQMDKIFMILKIQLTQGSLPLVLYTCIGMYPRSKVSVYLTIGPLVLYFIKARYIHGWRHTFSISKWLYRKLNVIDVALSVTKKSRQEKLVFFCLPGCR